jgi:hypothetical protein
MGTGPSGSAYLVRRRPALAAALLCAAVLAVLLFSQAPASAGPGSECVPAPNTLSPKVKSAIKRYTMLLRINKDKNIDAYANPDPTTGGLRKRIRDRDIFVVNTRDEKSTPEDWVALTERLRHEFPCNRIITLNGLAFDPTRPGYMFALTNNPGIWGLSLDWESGDWNQGHKQNPAVPPWSDAFGTTRGRIAKRLSALGAASDDELGPPGRRTGVVPAFYSWDYGLIAKTADRRNAMRKKNRPGFQFVQTQGYCSPSGPSGFYSIADHLVLQYRPKPRIKKIRNKKGKVIKRIKIRIEPRASVSNLAMEISFSNTPDPSDPRPVASLAPGAASKCTRAGLKRGVSAFLYWAHEDSIRALLNTPRICALRPPCG